MAKKTGNDPTFAHYKTTVRFRNEDFEVMVTKPGKVTYRVSGGFQDKPIDASGRTAQEAINNYLNLMKHSVEGD